MWQLQEHWRQNLQLFLQMNQPENLDSRTSQDVMGLLKITSRKYMQTIVMITHNEEIAQLADRIIRIEDGHIVTRQNGGQTV